MRDFRFLTLVISFFAASVFCAPFSWGGDPNTVENQGACDTADLCWDLVRDTTNDTGPSILIETNRSDEISFPRIYFQRVRVLTHPDSSWGHDEVITLIGFTDRAITYASLIQSSRNLVSHIEGFTAVISSFRT